MNEIELPKQDVNFKSGELTLNNYDAILRSAENFAKQVKSVEVTPETVKNNKKLRAAINKRVGELKKGSRDYKKMMLKPFDLFNEQINDIASIVDEANAQLDGQIKEIEQKERDEKENTLSKIYSQHLKRYGFLDYSFNQFINDHRDLLNKSVTLDKAEMTIAQTLNNINKDIEVISGLDDSAELIVAYKQNGHDLAGAISTVSNRKKAVEAAKAEVRTSSIQTPSTVFTIKDPKDAQLVQQYMELNNIEFTKTTTK